MIELYTKINNKDKIEIISDGIVSSSRYNYILVDKLKELDLKKEDGVEVFDENIFTIIKKIEESIENRTEKRVLKDNNFYIFSRHYF